MCRIIYKIIEKCENNTLNIEKNVFNNTIIFRNFVIREICNKQEVIIWSD